MAELRDDHGAVVLVVDDNQDVTRTLELLLAEMGCVVSAAQDHRTALELAKRIHPEIVLVDIVMPGMDGIELGEALRELAGMESTRIIGMSGYDAEHWRPQMDQAGFDGFLRKPVSAGQLASLVLEVTS